MFNVSRISKNLIAVSLFTTLLVVWLGSRYLYDARTLFSEATQLERSVIPESTLFAIQNSLDKERATTQQILLSADQQGNETQILRDLAHKSKDLFDQARKEITQSRLSTSNAIEHRYSQESIDLLFADLEDKFKRISTTRFVIASQTQRPIDERDDGVRMQLFDVYVKFIDTVNRLQKNYNSGGNFQMMQSRKLRLCVHLF